jgi:hypothetical protein
MIRVSYGYRGYRYDGRGIPVAEDMIRRFGLKPCDRILDVGCATGFLWSRTRLKSDRTGLLGGEIPSMPC